MNSKQLQFVTAEQGDQLRAAGFDWEVDYYFEKATGLRLRSHQPQNFNNDWVAHRRKVSAPTVAIALKWLRDVKDLKYAIFYDRADMEWFVQFRGDDGISYLPEPNGDNYEAAESSLLDELLILIGR